MNFIFGEKQKRKKKKLKSNSEKAWSNRVESFVWVVDAR